MSEIQQHHESPTLNYSPIVANMSSYYSSDDEVDVRIRHRREPSPSPVHYVQAVRPPRPRSYYATGPSYLMPEQTMVTTRTRSRSRERRSSPPHAVVAPPPAPVIINNRIYNEHSSDEEDGGRLVLRGRSHSKVRSRAGSSDYMTREDYELERTRRELEELKLKQRSAHNDSEVYELKRARRELEELRAQQERDRESRRTAKEYREEAELKAAKRELDEIKRKEELEAEEKRIKKEMELKRLEEERRAHEEKKRREKEAEEAVERYKQKEAERREKEKKEKEQAEKEYQRRLQEDLIHAGVDEKDIAAIIKKEKVKAEKQIAERPTYTRMARRHLSIETLRVYGIDFDYDTDPNYVLIKRWVPEAEQDVLWKHTRVIREKRDSKLLLTIEDKPKHHHGGDSNFEWVRKKERRRSKSPGLLMYLAGAK